MSRRIVPIVLAVLGVLSLASPVGANQDRRPFEGFQPDRPVRAAGQAPAADVPPGEHPVQAAVVPSDWEYGYQWGPKKVGMETAWDVTTGDSSTVIAVVDSGVDDSWEDLNGRVLPGWDFVDGDADTYDEFGHGTVVALIAAATGGPQGNDLPDIAGYCWQCQILPVRVLDENGIGNTGAVADGIEFAVDNGADVINLSLTGPQSSPTLQAAVEYAQAQGVVVVAAAGNYPDSGSNITAPMYPAALPGVVSVSASNRSDGLYSWSFRGSWSQVAAPGCVFYVDGEDYDCGTSYASPAVAAIIGLGMSVDPAATPESLKNALYTSVKPIAGVAHGRVDAVQFLTMLADDVEATRVFGRDRMSTATALSRRVYPTATDVVIARSDHYADALAAAPLAAAKGAPILLTPPSYLAGAVRDEIARLGATKAWIIGSTASISSSTESALLATSIDEVQRVYGSNRYATAGAIGQLLDTELGSDTVYVASAEHFADAASVSNLAAKEKAPILLVTRYTVPPHTQQALSAIQPTNIVVVGGPPAVDDSVLTALTDMTGATVEREGGANRYETSRKVALRGVTAGLSSGKVWVATGKDWPDALAAGPAAAAAGAVMMLTDPKTAVWVNYWLDGVTPTEVVVAGGTPSVTDPTMYSMQAHLP